MAEYEQVVTNEFASLLQEKKSPDSNDYEVLNDAMSCIDGPSTSMMSMRNSNNGLVIMPDMPEEEEEKVSASAHSQVEESKRQYSRIRKLQSVEKKQQMNKNYVTIFAILTFLFFGLAVFSWIVYFADDIVSPKYPWFEIKQVD